MKTNNHKNIGIFTEYYNNYNYGGNLQAFALQKFISKRLSYCEQIAFDFGYINSFFKRIKSIKKSNHREIACFFISALKSLIKSIIYPKENFLIKKRKSIIANFSYSITHSKKTYTKDDIIEANKDYDIFICGSDCIWDMTNNPYCTALGFVSDGKIKTSYAASLGSSTIPDGWADKYLDYVRELDTISVREKTVASELQKLIPEKEINVSVDPTLLFTAEEWDSFLLHKGTKSKYVLHYILSEDREQMQSALKYTGNCNCKSLTFPNIHNYYHIWLNDYGDYRNYSGNPLDFVELIKYAEVVITDSFHAVIFSVLFHKPFYALKRETQSEYVGRVENFLEDVGLKSQMITSKELESLKTIPQIDFTYADKVIAQNREKSIKYLEANLK